MPGRQLRPFTARSPSSAQRCNTSTSSLSSIQTWPRRDSMISRSLSRPLQRHWPAAIWSFLAWMKMSRKSWPAWDRRTPRAGKVRPSCYGGGHYERSPSHIPQITLGHLLDYPVHPSVGGFSRAISELILFPDRQNIVELGMKIEELRVIVSGNH
jgi:hypothetical protein